MKREKAAKFDDINGRGLSHGIPSQMHRRLGRGYVRSDACCREQFCVRRRSGCAGGECGAGGGGTYRFDVTVRHDDTGWEHYADRFEVLAPDGTVLGTRILHHPHVEEQPFTRSLTRVMVPADLKQVRIRAGDSVHGTGGAEVTIQLPSH